MCAIRKKTTHNNLLVPADGLTQSYSFSNYDQMTHPTIYLFYNLSYFKKWISFSFFFNIGTYFSFQYILRNINQMSKNCWTKFVRKFVKMHISTYRILSSNFFDQSSLFLLCHVHITKWTTMPLHTLCLFHENFLKKKKLNLY